MIYIIDACNKNAPSKREQFLLALAYNNLGILYTDYAIYYMNLYLNDGVFYNKKFKQCVTDNDIVNYQKSLFHFLLSNKYILNLEYDNALRHALIAYSLEAPKWNEVYLLISEIYYKKNDYNNAIAILNEGLKNTSNKFLIESYKNQKIKLEEKKLKKHIYKPNQKERLRKDFKTGVIYDLTSGVIK